MTSFSSWVDVNLMKKIIFKIFGVVFDGDCAVYDRHVG